MKKDRKHKHEKIEESFCKPEAPEPLAQSACG